MGPTVCLWGNSPGIERAIEMCRTQGMEILAILDNNPAKWGWTVMGVATKDPNGLPGLAPDHLLVNSMAFESICAQAQALGFPRERVHHFQPNPLEAIRRMCGECAACNYHYSCEGERLVVALRSHQIRGKVTADIPARRTQPEQEAIAAKLLDAFVRAMQDAGGVAPVYRVGENWGGVLRRSRNEMYEAVETRDARRLAGLLANYFRNDLSVSIIGGRAGYEGFARHQGQDPWLQQHLDVWHALVEGEHDLSEAAMPPIGNPYGYDVDGHVINWNSFVNHGRAHRCRGLLEEIGRPVVAEIGGGFGGFAYQLLRPGRPLTYVNFDLPENLMISSYTLLMAYPDKRILLYEGPGMDLSPERLAQHDAVMVPNFMLPAMREQSADYFINTISFSEMDHAAIREYFAQIDRVGRKYFYQENLSCHPGYKGYPVAVFPRLENFRLIFASFVPWHGMDANTIGHSYVAQLFERRGQGR